MMKQLFACLLLALFLGVVAMPAKANDKNDVQRMLAEFYAQRAHKPVWTGGERFNNRAKQLPALLEAARTHGLDPEGYGASRMKTVLDTEQPTGLNAWHQAEIFWTYGLWSYASDLMGQKLDAATLESVLDGDIAENLTMLVPDLPLYRALQDRLAQIDMVAGLEPAAGPSTPVVIEKFNFGRPLFRPGMSHRQVPELRARMVSFGAFDDAAPAPAAAAPASAADAAHIYDPQLAKAVGRFQQEYGLKDDGAIGPVTLDLLNRDAAQERRQIVANLQRLREPHRRLREDRRIEVSIARYWLTAYDGGHEAMSMPVVVGKPARQTISFRTEVSGVRLNPTWTVPSTIKKEDFIPQLLNDPAKLIRKYGVKVTHGGKAVDPLQTDWRAMTPRELSQVGFWQPAGDGNALGRYRVIMENPYDIYLHDTNHPELFNISSRAQSSGCVRVARPDELTAFILSGKQGWTPQKTSEILKKGQTVDVVIENKLPIYLDYMTAWFNHRGQLILGNDVYGLDKPRYDLLVKNGLTTQRNAQDILNRVTDILEPELKEAQNRDQVLTQSTN